MPDILMRYGEVYFAAARDFGVQRIDLLIWYFVAVSAVLAFWLQLPGPERQAQLRAPVSALVIVGSLFVAGLLFLISKDVYVYWTVGEKLTRQAVDAINADPPDRGIFLRKYTEAVQQFWDVGARERFLLWSVPPLAYGSAVSVIVWRWRARTASGDN